MLPQGSKLGPMKKYLSGYLAAVFGIVARDMLWLGLGLIAKAMLPQAIGHLVAQQPRPAAGWAPQQPQPARPL